MIRNICALLCLLSAGAQAATIQASSCSSTAVQSAINSASNGDTVALPGPCSATWNPGSITINAKAITLDGRGATITYGGSVTSNLINLSAHASLVTRITGFNFTGPGGGRFINVDTSSSDTSPALFRIDHNTFSGGHVNITVDGAGHGLIDHNSFTWSANSEVIQVFGYGAGSTTGWSNNVYPGTERATYIEDNTFTNNATPNFLGGKTAAFYGSREVVRFNTYDMTCVDNHGTAGNIGARWWEIYNNTFTLGSGENVSVFIQQRAGSGMIFNNSVPSSGAGSKSLTLWEEDSGYPAAYQIGRGKCFASPCTSGSNQALMPAYIWLRDPDMPLGISQASANQIVANRDYYVQGASFNGTSGVGAGPRAARPPTCTPGVAYWSTDQGEWNSTNGAVPDGTLDLCTASNTWTNGYYTPYAYPHPLIAGDSGGGGTVLSAPTNLRIVQ